MKYLLLLVCLGICLLLNACLPVVQDSRPQVAIINGPTEYKLDGLADALQAELERSPRLYRLTRPFPLRFQETHRDMYGSRADLQAAFIAQSQGAQLAVLVGLEGERSIEGIRVRGDEVDFKVVVVGTLVASIIEADSANNLLRFASPVFRATETVVAPLPEGVTAISPEFRQIVNGLADDVKLSSLTLQTSTSFTTELKTLAADLDEALSEFSD